MVTVPSAKGAIAARVWTTSRNVAHVHLDAAELPRAGYFGKIFPLSHRTTHALQDAGELQVTLGGASAQVLHSHSSARHCRCGKEIGRARGVGLYVVGTACVALTSWHLEALVILVFHIRAKGPNCAGRHVQIGFGHQVADDVQHDTLPGKGEPP